MVHNSSFQTVYIIYTFDKYGCGQNWKKHAETSDHAKAMAESQTLFDTKKYKRVELKQKSFNPHTSQWTAQTTHSWGDNKGKAKQVLLSFLKLWLGALGAMTAGFFQTQKS